MLTFAVFSVVMGLSAAYGDYGYGHPIEVPIKSYHRGTKMIPSASYGEKHITEVKVGPGEMPVHMTFMSKTSPIYVDQKHKKTKGSYKKSKSVDDPHKLVHEVVKPVYQTIKEVIKPYRKVVQVIEPIKEERLTMVHKHQGHDNSYNEPKYADSSRSYNFDHGQQQEGGASRSYNFDHGQQQDGGNSGSYQIDHGQQQHHPGGTSRVYKYQGALKNLEVDQEYLHR